MGKKGSWFSAIKKAFLPHSKDKLANESDRKNTKEKKKGLAKLRHGDTNSFIPLFREPSSIEKILDEAEREHKLVFRPPTPPEQPKTPLFVPRASSPRLPVTSPRATAAAASPRISSPRVASPRQPSPKKVHRSSYRPEPTLRNQHASATKIQAAYRGYSARRSFRALKGLVRLQGVVRGQSVKRQTMNAMKYMQMLVRVQSQIQSRRIQMLENQARRQAQYKNDKDVESILGKWNTASEAGNEDWDASVLTKEEIDARLQQKVNALIKRERAMAYAYSHQLWKSSPRNAQSTLSNVHSNGFPWWWNWLEKQLPPTSIPTPTQDNSKIPKKFQLTPPRSHPELKPTPSPRPSSSTSKNPNFAFDPMDTPTPRSSKSVAYFPPSRNPRTPVHRTPPPINTPTLSKYSRSRANDSPSPFNLPMKDDDSMTSCPPFSAPNYMAPTMSARAKARANSNPKERYPGTPSSEKRRLSFPQGIGSFKWNKGSFFSGGKDSSSQRGGGGVIDKSQSIQSVGNLSVDSTVSMPAALGRKPFNRFV